MNLTHPTVTTCATKTTHSFLASMLALPLLAFSQWSWAHLFNKFSRDRDIRYLNCRLSLKIKNWCLIDFHITCVWMIHHQIATSLINICCTTNFNARSDHINSLRSIISVSLVQNCYNIYEATQMSRSHTNSMILYNLLTWVQIRDKLDLREKEFCSVSKKYIGRHISRLSCNYPAHMHPNSKELPIKKNSKFATENCT